MLQDMRALSFHEASWSTHAVASYKISVPSCLLSISMPPTMHLPCSATTLGGDGEGFCTMNIPAVVLEHVRPNLVGSLPLCPPWTSPTSGTETECEQLERGLGNAFEVINLPFEATHKPYSSEEVIDLTGED